MIHAFTAAAKPRKNSVYSLFSSLIMHVHQMHAINKAQLNATKRRIEICMEGINELAKFWVIGKMVQVFFNSLFDNEQEKQEKLAAAASKRMQRRKRKRKPETQPLVIPSATEASSSNNVGESASSHMDADQTFVFDFPADVFADHDDDSNDITDILEYLDFESMTTGKQANEDSFNTGPSDAGVEFGSQFTQSMMENTPNSVHNSAIQPPPGPAWNDWVYSQGSQVVDTMFTNDQGPYSAGFDSFETEEQPSSSSRAPNMGLNLQFQPNAQQQHDPHMGDQSQFLNSAFPLDTWYVHMIRCSVTYRGAM